MDHAKEIGGYMIDGDKIMKEKYEVRSNYFSCLSQQS